jgi:hypothetical protein
MVEGRKKGESAEDYAKRLEAEVKSLKEDRSRIVLKVSQKGALSVYGLGRFPVTLYREQWVRVLEIAEEIKQFIHDHSKELNIKPTKE